MVYNLILKLHNLMLSQMMDWCSSYRTMVLTVWICLIVVLYVFFVTAFKTLWPYNWNEKEDTLSVICKAIENNNIVECIKLLEKFPQYINRFTKCGYTPFLIACANGNTQLVKLMLKKGANVKLKSLQNESAFYLAAFYYIKYPQDKNATCIRELYYAGADINEANDKHLTPLQMAAMFGHTPLVKWLLTKNAVTQIYPDPYFIAQSQGHQATAQVILRFTMNFYLTFERN